MKHRRAFEVGATVTLLIVVAGTLAGLYLLREHRLAMARALVRSVLAEDPAAVERLLKRGISARTPDGQVPVFFYAVMEDNAEITRLLLRHGADPNSPHPKDGDTPLHAAIRGGSTRMAALLLDSGASRDAAGARGETPLIAAVRLGHPRIAAELLKRRASVDARDEDGYTALMWAAYWGREELVRRLLAAGADAALKNEKGRTARDLAGERGHREVTRLLSAGKQQGTARTTHNPSA